MRALIVGGGIGGFALALALRRRGLDPIVIEQAPAFGEVGAGLQLSPNAVKALGSLGLAAAAEALAWRPDRAVVRDVRGAVLLETQLGSAARERWGAPYLQIHRADLHALLRRALEAAGGAAPLQGVAAQDVLPDGLRLADGRRLRGDLVIGADGVRSMVRRHIAGPEPVRFTGQVAWRGLARADDLEKVPTGAEVVAGAGRHFVSYRVRGGDLVNFVAVTQERAWRIESWSETGDKRELAAAFAAWPAETRALIAAAPQVLRWALYDRPPLRRWSKGPAAALGDAAHPMLPFLAQGAAMALEDAVVLDRCLAMGGTAAAALARYGAARSARAERVRRLSAFNARLFHAPDAVARAAFAAAGALDRLGDPGARFDWIYGYDPVLQPL